MPQIGTFTRDEAGFVGHLTTLMMAQDVLIVTAEPSETDNTPQYRVHIVDGETGEPGAEIGAAWRRTGERAGEYLALVIDDPALPQPILLPLPLPLPPRPRASAPGAGRARCRGAAA